MKCYINTFIRNILIVKTVNFQKNIEQPFKYIPSAEIKYIKGAK